MDHHEARTPVEPQVPTPGPLETPPLDTPHPPQPLEQGHRTSFSRVMKGIGNIASRLTGIEVDFHSGESQDLYIHSFPRDAHRFLQRAADPLAYHIPTGNPALRAAGKMTRDLNVLFYGPVYTATNVAAKGLRKAIGSLRNKAG